MTVSFQGGEPARAVAEAKGGGGGAALQVPGGGEAEESAGEARVAGAGPEGKGAPRLTGTIVRRSPPPAIDLVEESCASFRIHE